jgi:apolipoprotein N-acyltransferase
MLIAANTGFSAWIDGDGRVRAKGPRRAADIVLADVLPDSRGSLFEWWGGGPAACCLVFILFVIAWDARIRWTNRRRPGE